MPSMSAYFESRTNIDYVGQRFIKRANMAVKMI
ncbi:hypothetical protein predicted by Glimmer/Critica (plasmid) [Sinorhizobium fredii HH103]|uniref:Uncharacterized protein n=1 Tax=Sinorhizobium fredii (strain HH103) TaxID=1117943 RepID=G9AHS6_SINF1|nr:hypothetical protein predicted by Glimmer/Critica [Sinorhizobium fredii HH103]